ncbi:MAG TPA: aromatic ring-hydroxylating dioxygenase subunit alpha [Myxococcota bacterium]|nr:aromatic ring-hydroxylating dioxygenase subunit alpha [Myxococcota bacterium]
MAFVRNLWYVAAWSHDVPAGKPVGVEVLGEPLVLYRRGDGGLTAFDDRCPHRLAPLSLGRVEGDDLRCMYHGLRFAPDGRCVELPGSAKPPARLAARTFPVVERWSWIWVWPGDPAKADPARVPRAFGLEDPDWVYRSGALDYAADYELLNDNLCDLSHLDFVHEKSLGWASGSKWSNDSPRISAEDDGLRIERWFRDHPIMGSQPQRVDTWSSYRYVLPGLFLLTTQAFPVGTAEASGLGPPDGKPIFHRIDQQSVTPIGVGRSRYLWALGFPRAIATPAFLEGAYQVTRKSFDEDKRIIEAQQRIWERLPPERKPSAIPQDQAPAMFRRLVSQRLADETS